jgi:hypothetical protein
MLLSFLLENIFGNVFGNVFIFGNVSEKGISRGIMDHIVGCVSFRVGCEPFRVGRCPTLMLFEIPFTNINDQGITGVFDEVSVGKIIKIIDTVNENAIRNFG